MNVFDLTRTNFPTFPENIYDIKLDELYFVTKKSIENFISF